MMLMCCVTLRCFVVLCSNDIKEKKYWVYNGKSQGFLCSFFLLFLWGGGSFSGEVGSKFYDTLQHRTNFK